jgi:hypothetical protein
MSEALSQALESVGRSLERAVVDAERELIDARARCHALETEVRALRAVIRPMVPEPTAGSVPSPEADRQAVPPVALDALHDASTTGYLPMLEELWGIARDASA